ncbi:WXG100 family type VII secretion target [Nocardioides ginsengisegetis]|uniref:ESAT-6-like protein n=1 Tax=Nocardioides ginsengisegetis TaxID=661491 RepID=A0A7W3PAH3_9ACTN|nr:WXG100 family type VII secretion target [Nocardioides ginsengisegetis]MBA8804735.1 WXG100 family type VII secretion target [Nocardioides ginsengisegetis]
MSGFDVDLDELRRVVARVDACETAFEEIATDLAARVAALHGTWEGLAADAHLTAQARWEHGFARMREALRALHAAASGAEANYADAAATNQRMWEQVT